MYYFCSFIQVKKTKKYYLKIKLILKRIRKKFNHYLPVLDFRAFVELLCLM